MESRSKELMILFYFQVCFFVRSFVRSLVLRCFNFQNNNRFINLPNWIKPTFECMYDENRAMFAGVGISRENFWVTAHEKQSESKQWMKFSPTNWLHKIIINETKWMEILSSGLVDLRNKPHEFRSSIVKLNIFGDFQRKTNLQWAEKYRTMDIDHNVVHYVYSFKFCGKSHCQGPLEWTTNRCFFISLIFYYSKLNEGKISARFVVLISKVFLMANVEGNSAHNSREKQIGWLKIIWFSTGKKP